MSDIFTNAQYRAAIGSINFNGSNYQVFSFSISLMMLIGIVVILGSLVAIQSEDDLLSTKALQVFSVSALFCVAGLFIAYISYLKNIGKYIYGRMKPFDFIKSSDCRPSLTSETTSNSRSLNKLFGI